MHMLSLTNIYFPTPQINTIIMPTYLRPDSSELLPTVSVRLGGGGGGGGGGVVTTPPLHTSAYSVIHVLS